MKVAGIDVSTFAVDVVLVPYEGNGAPAWHRFPLVGSDAFDRTRSVADAMPGGSSVFWDDVLAVGIEEPAGRNPGVIFRVQGAVLAQIPARMLVTKSMPSEWRRAVGLKGNASKRDIYAHVSKQHRPSWAQIHMLSPENYLGASNATAFTWAQDAADAYCIAVATRRAITTEQAA